MRNKQCKTALDVALPRALITFLQGSYLVPEVPPVSSARIFAALQALSSCPSYVRIWILMADESLKRDFYFFLLRELKNGEPHRWILFTHVKRGHVDFLDSFFQKTRLKKRQQEDFAVFTPNRCKELILEGLHDRCQELKDLKKLKKQKALRLNCFDL